MWRSSGAAVATQQANVWGCCSMVRRRIAYVTPSQSRMALNVAPAHGRLHVRTPTVSTKREEHYLMQYLQSPITARDTRSHAHTAVHTTHSTSHTVALANRNRRATGWVSRSVRTAGSSTLARRVLKHIYLHCGRF